MTPQSTQGLMKEMVPSLTDSTSIVVTRAMASPQHSRWLDGLVQLIGEGLSGGRARSCERRGPTPRIKKLVPNKLRIDFQTDLGSDIHAYVYGYVLVHCEKSVN